MAKKQSQSKESRDQRSQVFDPTTPAFKHAQDNRSIQLNTKQGKQNDPNPTIDKDDDGDYGAWESADS